MRNISDKSRRENQNTFCDQKRFLENSAFYEIMRKNNVEPDSPQGMIRRMLISCWIPKATNTLSERITRVAFPLQ